MKSPYACEVGASSSGLTVGIMPSLCPPHHFLYTAELFSLPEWAH